MRRLLALALVALLAAPLGAEITLPCPAGDQCVASHACVDGEYVTGLNADCTLTCVTLPTTTTTTSATTTTIPVASYTTVLNSFEAPGDLPPSSPGSCDDEFNNGTTIDGAWSWVNQGGATIAQTSGYQLLEAPASGSDDFRLRCRTAPSVPFTLTARIACGMASSSATSRCAIAVRNSGTQHFTQLGPANTGSLVMNDHDWNSVTSAAGNRLNDGAYNGYQYVRLVVASATAYSGWVSSDGVVWQRVFNVTGDGFVGTPDQVCFAADDNNSAVVDTLLYWFRCQ